MDPLFVVDMQMLLLFMPQMLLKMVYILNYFICICLSNVIIILDFMYQEAFLTTYRTFISPLELIQKLCFRHQRFQNSGDLNRQRAGRESFSLLVRVVSDLT